MTWRFPLAPIFIHKRLAGNQREFAPEPRQETTWSGPLRARHVLDVGPTAALDAVEQVPHLFLLRSQVGMRHFVYARLAGDSLNHLDAALFELPYFLRIVR